MNFFEQLGIQMASAALQKLVTDQLAIIKEHNTPEVYNNLLATMEPALNLFMEVARKTKTKIDDTAILIFLAPIMQAKSENEGV